MIQEKKELKTIEVTSETTKICDRCDFTVESSDADFVEFQEFVHIRISGGYGSAFGDGDNVACDFCQKCALEVLGPYCRGVNAEWGETIEVEKGGYLKNMEDEK